MRRALKVQLLPAGARWINPDHIVWVDDSLPEGWAAAVNPSPEGVQVSPTQTPTTRTFIGLIDRNVIVAGHTVIEILTALGLTRWQTNDGMEIALVGGE